MKFSDQILILNSIEHNDGDKNNLSNLILNSTTDIHTEKKEVRAIAPAPLQPKTKNLARAETKSPVNSVKKNLLKKQKTIQEESNIFPYMIMLIFFMFYI